MGLERWERVEELIYPASFTPDPSPSILEDADLFCCFCCPNQGIKKFTCSLQMTGEERETPALSVSSSGISYILLLHFYSSKSAFTSNCIFHIMCPQTKAVMYLKCMSLTKVQLEQHLASSKWLSPYAVFSSSKNQAQSLCTQRFYLAIAANGCNQISSVAFLFWLL